MKKALSLSLAAIGLLLSFATKAQSPNPLYHHLPPTADHITEINFNQVNEKGNLTALLGAIPPTGNPAVNMFFRVLGDPSGAGIDLGNNILVAQTAASGTDADSLDFTSIMFRLTDSAKFRALLAQALPGLEVNTVAGKGSTVAKDRLGLAWNDKLAVITQATRSASVMVNGQTPAAYTPPAGDLAVAKSLEAIGGFSGTPWLTDQRFLTGFATNEDVHFWSSKYDPGKFFSKLASKAMKGNPAMKMPPRYAAATLNVPVLSTFNFGNGKIEFRMKLFYTPDAAATFRNSQNGTFNKDLLARVPGGTLLGCMAFHFNPSSVSELMEKYHTRHMVDSLLAKAGMTLDDFLAPFTGDFLLAATLPKSAVNADSVKKQIQFYFVAGIADPAKLMKLGAKFHGMAGQGMDTAKHNPFSNLPNKMVVKNNLLVISKTKTDAEKYFTNTERRSTDLLGNPVNMFDLVVDLKVVSSLIGSSMSNDPKAMIAARVLENLDKLVFTSGTMEGDTMVTDFQITTGDPNTNSLTTLMSIMH